MACEEFQKICHAWPLEMKMEVPRGGAKYEPSQNK